MRALAKWAIKNAKQRAESGDTFTAAHMLELIESHENLREAYEDALRRATGHAYATGMAEAGEDIQAQELERERKDHAETRAERRRYEEELQRIASLYSNTKLADDIRSVLLPGEEQSK